MKFKVTIILIIAVLVLAVFIVWRLNYTATPIKTEVMGNEMEKYNLIRVQSPRPGDVVSSPLTIKGEARGTWYFEASFPISLWDADGNQVIVEPSYIMTSADWMTSEFVPFEVNVTFTPPATPTGRLILHKDNPSGLPENDDSLVIPVRFFQN